MFYKELAHRPKCLIAEPGALGKGQQMGPSSCGRKLKSESVWPAALGAAGSTGGTDDS